MKTIEDLNLLSCAAIRHLFYLPKLTRHSGRNLTPTSFLAN
nr:MAG TPA: hypothetical protein [Caudoviricetes sp.]